MARPTGYTPELGDLICAGVARAVSLATLCDNSEELPDVRTVYRWLREHEEFCQNYTRAREDQADFLAEESIDIADNQAGQVLVVDGLPVLVEKDGEKVPVIVKDAASIGHAKLRVETRKWYASKMKPKKYGDRIHTEHSGSVGLTDMSQDELDRRIAALEQEKRANS